ncbi:hypothetical protein HJFPF1_08362 [Paramyrothecium foliicola]|nr:hypothetical protein HJFPF1_10719 [Paramyrothecium foliicola]KAI9155773.1 hypothetical protein HJFPF1_08362 [Paramyrothecium foliicola]
MPEGRQSPSPERQTGAQIHDTPGDGQGIEQVHDKHDKMEVEVDKLESNPKGPLEDHLKELYGEKL